MEPYTQEKFLLYTESFLNHFKKVNRPEYWVQIEMEPNGQQTGYMHLDLSKVTKVEVLRDQANNEEVNGVIILYANLIQPIVFKKYSATRFIDFWTGYANIPSERTNPIAEKGLIMLANSAVNLPSGGIH